MTPEQIELVQSSFAALVDSGEADAMATAFYDGLFTRAPDLRVVFTTDREAQRAGFIDELQEIVAGLPHLEVFVESTRAMGERHLDRGVTARHYGPMGESLIAALGQTLGDRFTPAVADAWTLANNLVAETMMQAAADARGRGAER